MQPTVDREKSIVRTSLTGIIANVFLAAFKAAVGLISNSMAVILDAVNNLSDALSSVITIIGTKLANRAPDRQHPLGHGRTEYLSATVIAIIVLYAGITSLVESVKKIIHPETPSYTVWALVIIGAAVVVKLLLGRYVKARGEALKSDALVASGSDALFDAVISLSTLVAAAVFMLTGLSLEAYLAAVISLYIIKSGFEMLKNTLSEIIGHRADAELARRVKNCVCSFEQVRGAYDLVIHNYGPEKLIASVHIELPDTMTVGEADSLERAISDKVYAECGVILTGISVYSINTRDSRALRLETQIREMLREYPGVLQMHGFYLDEEASQMRFDIIISFDEKDRNALRDTVAARVSELAPDLTVTVVADYDITD